MRFERARFEKSYTAGRNPLSAGQIFPASLRRTDVDSPTTGRQLYESVYVSTTEFGSRSPQ